MDGSSAQHTPAEETLTAPLSGRECVYYIAIVKAAGKHSTILAREEAWYFSKTRTFKRELRAAPRWKIGELPENTMGRVVGTARPVGEPLIAPLTGRPCVYFLVIVTSGGKSPSAVAREERGNPFMLDDPSGAILIEPKGAEVVLDVDSHTHSGTFDAATSSERGFLERHNISSTNAAGLNRSLVYTEAVISVGETIAVLGAAEREQDPAAVPGGGYRDALPSRLRMTSHGNLKIRICDDVSTTN